LRRLNGSEFNNNPGNGRVIFTFIPRKINKNRRLRGSVGGKLPRGGRVSSASRRLTG
jgi:hypothetical protein